MKLRTGNEIEDVIPEVEAGYLQEIDDVPVMQGHRPEGSGSLIPGRIWDPYIPADQNGASIKGKLHLRITVDPRL
jgi:hypothetical protein